MCANETTLIKEPFFSGPNIGILKVFRGSKMCLFIIFRSEIFVKLQRAYGYKTLIVLQIGNLFCT